MNIGMLWMDLSKDELSEKVERAASYYQQKYGKVPNRCYVHPSMTNLSFENYGGVEVHTSRQVLPNHLWMGVHEDSEFYGEGIAD